MTWELSNRFMFYKKALNSSKDKKLSLFEKYTKAWNEKDISAFVECHHDDYE